METWGSKNDTGGKKLGGMGDQVGEPQKGKKCYCVYGLFVHSFSTHHGDVFFVNDSINPVWYISLGEYKEFSTHIARKLNNIHNMCNLFFYYQCCSICMLIDITGIIAHLAGIIYPDLLCYFYFIDILVHCCFSL